MGPQTNVPDARLRASDGRRLHKWRIDMRPDEPLYEFEMTIISELVLNLSSRRRVPRNSPPPS